VKRGPQPGFVRISPGRGASAVWSDPELADPLRALGWHRGDLAWAADPRRAPGAVGAPTGRGRAPAAVIALPDRADRILLRSLRHGGWWAPLWGPRLGGPGRGWREVAAAALLSGRGAPVPRPRCLAVRRRSLGWEVAVGHGFVEDAVDGRTFLESRPPREAVVAAARAAGRAVARFHDCGGRHRDLQIGNLLIARASAEGADARAWVIDLDRARVGAPPAPARRLRELARLWRSIRKWGLDAPLGSRGVAAFFGAYCGGDRALRRALRCRWPVERARLLLHRRKT
jgi:hypothetical protein